MFRHILLKGGRFVTGVAMKKFVNTLFDYLLYPVVLSWLGYIWGGVALTALAFGLNLLIIRAYDWAKVDWFFIEDIKKIRDGEDIQLPGFLNWLKPILRKGDVAAFFVLCFDDPITATLYLRKGSHLYNGFSRREWHIFTAANVVANLYWILGWSVVLESVKRIY